jgi:acyl-CoA thioesterase I
MVAAAAVTFAVAAEGSSSADPQDVTPLRRGRVVVLGDSLAVSPDRSRAFPSHLQAEIQRRGAPWVVVNAGINGDTTTGGLRRVEALLDKDVDVLIVALGANDGLRGVPLPTVEQNLSAIIDIARRRNVSVLLCGMETPPTRGWDYTLGFHNVFPRIAKRHAVPLVPFLLTGVALVREMNGPDGVHPNAEGARRIADNVWPHLESLLVLD